MEPEVLALMIMFIVAILTTGGVLILRPIAKRIGDLLELYASDRREGLQSEVQQMRDLLETVSARMQLLEERQEFTERLRGELPPSGQDRIERGRPVA